MVCLANPVSVLAQTELEDAMATDEYQDSFMNHWKQKGIENYDKAIRYH